MGRSTAGGRSGIMMMNDYILAVIISLTFLIVASIVVLFVLVPALATSDNEEDEDKEEQQQPEENSCIDMGDTEIVIDCDRDVHLAEVMGGYRNVSDLAKNILVQKGELIIDPSDTQWLRLVDNSSIRVEGGSLNISDVKISSWDEETQTYVPATQARGYIFIQRPGGNTSIINSELAYLGFKTANLSENHGLVYYDMLDKSQRHILRNNSIHDNHMGLFTRYASNMLIENNRVFDNILYGLDPHTSSTDLVIRNNTVYGNGHIGVICSGDCLRIAIIGNEVHDNQKGGIMLSRNTNNSAILNNLVYNQTNSSGISVSASSNNTISGNDVRYIKDGIDLKAGSMNNTVTDNEIVNYGRSGVRILANTTQNTVDGNTVELPQGSKGKAIAVNAAVEGNNTVGDNLIIHPLGSEVANRVRE